MALYKGLASFFTFLSMLVMSILPASKLETDLEKRQYAAPDTFNTEDFNFEQSFWGNEEEVISTYEIVEHSADLFYSTKDYVIVLKNDSIYGDGGVCIFKKMDATSWGYLRADGSHVYPVPGQGVLQQPNAPYNEIMRVVKTYCNNHTLVYGQSNTLYSNVCENGIDCSSFVSAVLHGIDYDHSRYKLGTESQNMIGSNPIMLVEYLDSIGWQRLVTNRMAQYFAEQKQLFAIDYLEPYSAVSKLRFGDILFISYPPEKNEFSRDSYYNIGHVALVLGTIPDENCILVVQGGDSPKGLTLFSNEKTVVKTTVLKVTKEELQNHLRLFARPQYVDVPLRQAERYRVTHNTIQYYPKFQMNTSADIYSEGITLARKLAATPDYYPAVGGAKLINNSPHKIEGAVLHCYIAEYDRNYELICRTEMKDIITLQDETCYLRFTCGLDDTEEITPTLEMFDQVGLILQMD